MILQEKHIAALRQLETLRLDYKHYDALRALKIGPKKSVEIGPLGTGVRLARMHKGGYVLRSPDSRGGETTWAISELGLEVLDDLELANTEDLP